MRPPHTLITFSGQFEYGTTVLEQWSFSLRCDPDMVQTPEEMNTVAAAARGVYVNALKPVLDASVALTKTTVASVTDAGVWAKDSGGAFYKGEYVGHDVGLTDGGAQLPVQSAVCVTLLTNRAGATGKGRIFLPTPKENLDVSGRLTQGKATTYADAVKALVNGLNGVAGPGPVRVFSSKGYASDVTSIRCGRVVDTLRSRRGDMLEEYVTVPLS